MGCKYGMNGEKNTGRSCIRAAYCARWCACVCGWVYVYLGVSIFYFYLYSLFVRVCYARLQDPGEFHIFRAYVLILSNIAALHMGMYLCISTHIHYTHNEIHTNLNSPTKFPCSISICRCLSYNSIARMSCFMF